MTHVLSSSFKSDMQMKKAKTRAAPKSRCYVRGRAVLVLAFLLLPGVVSDSSDQSSSSSNSTLSIGAGAPRLAYLAVRSFSRPVDLAPAFSPAHYIYSAVLDYASEHFAIDAFPASKMEIDNAGDLQTIRVVQPGSSVRVGVTVRDTNSGTSMQYTVAVKRLSGSDVVLKSLETPGAMITPVFVPEITDYLVSVPAELDQLYLRFAPADNGQRFSVTATMGSLTLASTTSTTQVPFDAPDSNPNLAPVLPVAQPASSSDSGSDSGSGSGRRLDDVTSAEVPPPLSGEVQYNVIQRWFPIEVGKSRLINIVVTPAAGVALNRTYRLQTTRVACPEHRPYFAPDVAACSMTCNYGFFPDSAALRCEACPDHCLRCLAWDSCQICEQSEWRLMKFFIFKDGRCIALKIPWLRIIEGSAVVISVLSILTCCICACCHELPRRKSRVAPGRLQQQRREDDGPESNRLLDGGSDYDSGEGE